MKTERLRLLLKLLSERLALEGKSPSLSIPTDALKDICNGAISLLSEKDDNEKLVQAFINDETEWQKLLSDSQHENEVYKALISHLANEVEKSKVGGNNQVSLWDWFGFSRASFLTLPRVLMHEMPIEWQNKMATLLIEYEETFDTSDIELKPLVVAKNKNGKFVKIPEFLLNYRHPDKEMIEGVRVKCHRGCKGLCTCKARDLLNIINEKCENERR